MPELISSEASKGANLEMFMKLTAIVILLVSVFFARGVRPGIVITIMIVPLWLFVEKMMSETDSPSLWKSIEEREDFSRLPLADDINKMKGAKKGQKVKQAIIEGRLKDQVYSTLKNEYNLSEEELTILDDDMEKMAQKVDNEVLVEYIKNATDLNDLKRPDGQERLDLFSKEKKRDIKRKNIKFEEKIKSAIAELESIHFVEEEGELPNED